MAMTTPPKYSGPVFPGAVAIHLDATHDSDSGRTRLAHLVAHPEIGPLLSNTPYIVNGEILLTLFIPDTGVGWLRAVNDLALVVQTEWFGTKNGVGN
jgi:hypothetical protein